MQPYPKVEPKLLEAVHHLLGFVFAEESVVDMNGLDAGGIVPLVQGLVQQGRTDGRVHPAADEHEDDLVPSDNPPDVIDALLLPFLERKVAAETADLVEEVMQHLAP